METQAKKSRKKYEKQNHPYTTINVTNYLTGTSANASHSTSIRYLLIKYLRSHRYAEFANYQEIADALRKEFSLKEDTCSKGAISKAVKGIQGDLVFDDGTYFFKKVNRVYKLQARFSTDNPSLIELFKIKDAFLREDVHFIGNSTVVFSVNPKHIQNVKDKLLTLLGSSACFGIMSHEEYLVVMLNENSQELSNSKSMLENFFVQKKSYDKKILEQKLRDQMIREARKKKGESRFI